MLTDLCTNEDFLCLFVFEFCSIFSQAVSTKEVILGTDNGQLHELAVDEKDKKEKYIKFLFDLTELPEAFMGLQVLLLSSACPLFQVHFARKLL